VIDFHPKKRFGQNFLRDSGTIEKILAAAGLHTDDRVLEIGPGFGALTDRLLERAGMVEVLEVDRDLAERLRQRGVPNLIVHEGDALRLDWEALLATPPYKLVANLPYNISSQILFRILDHRQLFSRLVLMFQQEVADRLCASPGSRDYGILSVFCHLWFDIRRVATVPPGAFYPPPKINSTVLLFESLPTARVFVADEPLFRRVVKGAFAQRRKTLRNTLTSAGFTAGQVAAALAAADIDPVRRGETLDLQEFANLAAAFATAQSLDL
jgi:16S rRNA (adenine1518-N6/adenine1519-N6)-dimethyltransferase